MYSYIKGELVEIMDDVIVVEAGQIGYNIHIPASMIDNFTGTGQQVKIYTYLQVKEDDMQLYGSSSCCLGSAVSDRRAPLRCCL